MIIPNQLKREAYRNNKKMSDIALDSLFTRDTGYDAKHILNLSSKRPNIDLTAIEAAGISLEDLSGLNVPICKYKTQITLHGTFPQAELGYCRATGYKSLVLNKNCSVGIRWVAVDGEKKQLVSRAFHADKDCKWRFHQNSTGTEITLCGTIADIDKLTRAAVAVPKSTYIGSAFVIRAPMFGIAWAGVSIAALRDVWGFISHLTGINSIDDLEAIELKERELAEVEAEKRREKNDELQRKNRESIEKLKAEREIRYNLKSVEPKAGGHYIRFLRTYGGGSEFGHCQVAKSFGRLTMRTETFKTIEDAKQAVIRQDTISKKGRTVNDRTVFYSV